MTMMTILEIVGMIILMRRKLSSDTSFSGDDHDGGVDVDQIQPVTMMTMMAVLIRPVIIEEKRVTILANW